MENLDIQTYVNIDGEFVSLAECDWLWCGPEGCVYGALIGRDAASADVAHSQFERVKRERERQLSWGFSMRLAKHSDFGEKVAPCLRGECGHVRPTWIRVCKRCHRLGKDDFRTVIQDGKPVTQCAYEKACKERYWRA